MKKSLKSTSLVLLGLSFTVLSCNKIGPGGTSSIQGQITGSEFSQPRQEITEVIVTSGDQVEHGDYWILNSSNTSNYYYIWYNNPTWVSNGDPQLNGRTGIEVGFNYSDSNTDIAQNTFTAIDAIAQGIEIVILNDILTITTTQSGNVPDADKVSSPFELNVSQQGRDIELTASSGLVDEKVYISYGDNELYDDEIRTGEKGRFSFNGLNKGSYTVFTFTTDTVTYLENKLSTIVEITDKKSIVDAGIFNIIK